MGHTCFAITVLGHSIPRWDTIFTEYTGAKVIQWEFISVRSLSPCHVLAIAQAICHTPKVWIDCIA